MQAAADIRLTNALEWCQAVIGANLTAELVAADASPRRYFRITPTGASQSPKPLADAEHARGGGRCESFPGGFLAPSLVPHTSITGDFQHQPAVFRGFSTRLASPDANQAADPISYILMDAPDQGKDIAAFVRVGEMMRQAGLNTPERIAADYRRGLLLLTDLGNTTYLSALTVQGQDPDSLYSAAISALVNWQRASRPARLPRYSKQLLHAELELFTTWYLHHHCGLHLSAYEQQAIERLFARIVWQMTNQPQVYVHRDFMPRNLMLTDPLPGVLDYQDAVIGPASYDPVCLYRDAFLSWSQEFVYQGLYNYWQKARQAGIPLRERFEDFWLDCQWTSLQRHFKVIGIFARLFYRDGKRRYLEDIPRFFDYLQSAAETLGCTDAIQPILQRAQDSGGTR